MKFDRTTIYNSSFLNIYSFCTDKICIVSEGILPKEEKKIEEMLDVRIIKTAINRSPLIGVFLSGVGEKIIVEKNSIYPEELNFLEKEGLKVKTINNSDNAFGNLLAINSNYGFISPLFLPETIKDIQNFFKIPIEQKACIGLDLPGSSIYVNDSLFLINPRVDSKEFNYIKKMFKVPGLAITANYGDVFVGNDTIGNKNGLLVGELTSNIEMTKIDDLVLSIDEV